MNLISLSTWRARGSEARSAEGTFPLPDGPSCIVHVTHREGLSAIFQAQVLTPLGHLSEQGYEVHSVVFAPVGQLFRPALRARWKELRRAAGQKLSGKLHVLPSPPSRLRGLWSDERVLASFLRRFGRNRERLDLLHARGANAAVLALEARRASGSPPVIYDCRGVSVHEIMYDNGLTSLDELPLALRQRVEKILVAERRAAVESDVVLAVSGKLRDYLVEAYAIPREKVEVVPCCVPLPEKAQLEQSRRRIRAELGWEEAFVVCYSGSLASWQLPEESAQTFKLIHEREPRARFLGLTTSLEKLTHVFREAGIAQQVMHIRRVPQSDVADWLAAADLGLLLRERSIVNEVASPTKFGEYMAAGLPVLISEGIGDYSGAVRDQRLGVVATAGEGWIADVLHLSSDPQRLYTVRERARRFAGEELSWDRLARTMVEMPFESHEPAQGNVRV